MSPIASVAQGVEDQVVVVHTDRPTDPPTQPHAIDETLFGPKPKRAADEFVYYCSSH